MNITPKDWFVGVVCAVVVLLVGGALSPINERIRLAVPRLLAGFVAWLGPQEIRTANRDGWVAEVHLIQDRHKEQPTKAMFIALGFAADMTRSLVRISRANRRLAVRMPARFARVTGLAVLLCMFNEGLMVILSNDVSVWSAPFLGWAAPLVALYSAAELWVRRSSVRATITRSVALMALGGLVLWSSRAMGSGMAWGGGTLLEQDIWWAAGIGLGLSATWLCWYMVVREVFRVRRARTAIVNAAT